MRCNFTGKVGDPALSFVEKISLFFVGLSGLSEELSEKLDEVFDSVLCSCLELELLSVPLSVACLSSLSGSPSLGELSLGELSEKSLSLLGMLPLWIG